MATKTLKTPAKISVKIWRPIIDKLDQKLDAACLRRDAYLNKVLENELPLLDSEVSLANSPAAQAFVASRLDQLDRKLVSLTLRPELIDQLNDICLRKRIVRDAFFNRLFLLLALKPKAIDALFFLGVDGDWKEELWRDTKGDSQFWLNGLYPLEPAVTPFWAIRTVLKIYAEATGFEEYQDPDTGKAIQVQREYESLTPLNSVYTAFFADTFKDTDLSGLNCHVPDWRVPDTAAAAKRKELDDMLIDI